LTNSTKIICITSSSPSLLVQANGPTTNPPFSAFQTNEHLLLHKTLPQFTKRYKQEMTSTSSYLLARGSTLTESETEDEEVRMNCIGGLRGMDDSDINSTDGSESDDEDDAEEK
jgi:hypothetical protein